MTVWCKREECPSPVAQRELNRGWSCCTGVCAGLDDAMSWVQKLAERYPDDPVLTEEWTVLVEAGDAWAEYRRLVCESTGVPTRPQE